jgi:hypothetical protein
VLASPAEGGCGFTERRLPCSSTHSIRSPQHRVAR